jgi:hypothetical protein
MSKPDDIPQDIWDTVDNMPICGDGFPNDSDYEVIARTILAERERCAVHIERRNGEIPFRQEIAHDIRNGVAIDPYGTRILAVSHAPR